MHPRAFLAIIPLAAALPACSELKTDMKMAGEMKMQMDGNIKMDGAMAMKIEGPIQMTLQGPTITYAGTYVSEKLLEQVQEQEQAQMLLRQEEKQVLPLISLQVA